MTENNINIIYLRHGIKLFSNGKKYESNQYQFDPPLHKKHLHLISTKKHEIIQKFGNISTCISSPFKRTRETALKLYDGNIEIDSDICEFFGSHTKCDNILDGEELFDQITNSYDIQTIGESSENLINRLNKHINYVGLNNLNINTKYLKNGKCNILIITHGTIIKKIYNLLTKNLIERPKELSGFYISGNLGNIIEIGII